MTDARPAAGISPRQLNLLATAHAVSSYGSHLNLVALGLFAFEITGSGLQTGLFMALRLGSGFVAGPVAGTLAARYPRRPLMIGCDLLSATAITALVVAPAAVQPILLYGLAVVLGATQTQWGVALRASVPELVGADRRTRANSQLVTARSIAMLLGFASAGVLVSQWGYHRAFLLDAASYLICALLLLGVPFRATRAATGPSQGRDAPVPTGTRRAGRTSGVRAWTAVSRGLPAILLSMIAVRTLDAFGSASHNIGLPIYANLASPDDPATFAATFLTAWAAGSLIAGRWLSWRGRRGELSQPELVFGVATCLMSIFFVLSFADVPLWLLIPLAGAAGAADGIAEITYTARLQDIDESVRAQAFGFASSAQNAGFGLGMVGCAMLLDIFPPFPVVAAAHSTALAAAAVFLIVRVRALLTARRHIMSPRPTVKVSHEYDV